MGAVWKGQIKCDNFISLATLASNRHGTQGDQIGRFIRIHYGHFLSWAVLIQLEVAQILVLLFPRSKFRPKIGWATFWANISQTHLATLTVPRSPEWPQPRGSRCCRSWTSWSGWPCCPRSWTSSSAASRPSADEPCYRRSSGADLMNQFRSEFTVKT
jgi:hypothetical protein